MEVSTPSTPSLGLGYLALACFLVKKMTAQQRLVWLSGGRLAD
jgi:hypothetical protein